MRIAINGLACSATMTGRLRFAESPVIFSLKVASPGTRSRKFARPEKRDKVGA